MDSVFGGEICALVVRYALEILRKDFSEIRCSFSRDDGLSYFRGLKVLDLKKIKENFASFSNNIV